MVAGDERAACRLSNAFGPATSGNRLDDLGQTEDLERARRYDRIWRMLVKYSHASPEVPDINDIVPLPPATLPVWDGKLQWLEEHLTHARPEHPGLTLIDTLAKAMLLDPATGKPTPESPAFGSSGFPGAVVPSSFQERRTAASR